MVVEAILDNLREMIWKKVKSVEKYPEEYGTREDMEKTADDIQTEYKNRQRQIKISEQCAFLKKLKILSIQLNNRISFLLEN